MKRLPTADARPVWFGASSRPYTFSCPASGEYALLLVVGTEDVTPEEQAELATTFVRSGCRYAVCFGPDSSSWDDAIDMVGVLDEVEGRRTPFVMTTWHDDEPIEETAEFFVLGTRFDGWSPNEFVVFVLGGPEALRADVQDAVLRQFRDDPP